MQARHRQPREPASDGSDDGGIVTHLLARLHENRSGTGEVELLLRTGVHRTPNRRPAAAMAAYIEIVGGRVISDQRYRADGPGVEATVVVRVGISRQLGVTPA